jgi:hypothetical protein
MVCIITANFSSQQQEDTKDRCIINFHGTLTTVQNKSYKVDTILLSGLYRDIPVYAKPLHADINPAIDTTRLNLSDIRSISRPTNPEQQGIIKFKNREYIEIIVTWKGPDNKTDTYIIERSRQLWCFESNTVRTKKEVALEALVSLEIEGSSCQSQSEKRSELNKESKELQESYHQIAKIITDIEQEAQKVMPEVLKQPLVEKIRKLKHELRQLIH